MTRPVNMGMSCFRAAAVGAAVLILTSCALKVLWPWPAELTVEFVFENGFLGKAEILEDQPDGTPVICRGNRLVYVFPRGGVLKIGDRDPAEGRWFTWVARYRSGQPIIPVATNIVKPGTIIIRHAGTYVRSVDDKELRGSIYYVERYVQ